MRAVGVDFFTRLVSGELDPAEVDDNGQFGMKRMGDMMAVRTRFFDDFFVAAADSGIRQAVILASGLDARAYRLAWPAGTTVFEIDQSQVIEFKTADLGRAGRHADRRSSGGTRRPARRLAGGAAREPASTPTNPPRGAPKACMPFLPPDAQDRLLDNITELSPAGSQLATENLPEAPATVCRRWPTGCVRSPTSWREHGFDVEMTDLWYAGDRHDVVDYLSTHGWATAATSCAGFGCRLWAFVTARIQRQRGDPHVAALRHRQRT